MQQPEWDKYEVALLIEAYWNVYFEGNLRDAIIRRLSEQLRRYGEKKHCEIDEIYRNCNGISLRLGELEWLFSNGKHGVNNTSRLFKELADLFRKDQKSFNKLLHEAYIRVVGENNNRKDFLSWLSEQSRVRIFPKDIIEVLDEGSGYAVEQGISGAYWCDVFSDKQVSIYLNRLLTL